MTDVIRSLVKLFIVQNTSLHFLQLRGYLIKVSGFGYIVNPNMDSVKKLHSVNGSEDGFGFGEPCLNPISLAAAVALADAVWEEHLQDELFYVKWGVKP